MRSPVRLFVVGALLLVAGSTTGVAQPLPPGDPRALGFSPERLATIKATLQRFVDSDQRAGVSWLVARRGRVVDRGAVGYRDLESRLPMESTTIVRIYSMSKMVTSVAVLILFEEGRLRLEEPVAAHIPEFGGVQVMTGGTADAPLLATARRPITIKHLLTHTSGLVYGDAEGDALERIHSRAKLREATSLQEWTRLLATLPLRHHPGEAFTYGVSTDVLGRLVEVVSGQPLGAFLAQRIFAPLGMGDTGFDVPPEKQGRIARIYRRSKEGSLERADPIGSAWPDAGLELGGEGLFSTIDDFARFGQMLLNGGQLDGRRILGRKTVEFMTTNHLSGLPDPRLPDLYAAIGPALGFGLGVAVRIDPGRSGYPGSIGQFGWGGAASTHCQVDPQEQIVALVLSQHFPFHDNGLFEAFATGYYQALVD